MKKLLSFLVCIFAFIGMGRADTKNIDWIVGGNTYAQTSCNVGNDLILPAAPTKYGYTFRGWTQYIPLEYIESTGTQWIDTGIALYAAKDDFEAVFQLTGQPSETSYLFGARDSSTSSTYTFGTYSNSWRFGWKNASPAYGTADTNKHKVFINHSGGSLYIDDELLVSLGNSSTITPRTATIFGVQAASGSAIYYGRYKVYYAKIWRNGTLLQHFVPVKRASDNAIGMFDRVSQTFFTNSGTGSFTAGPEL